MKEKKVTKVQAAKSNLLPVYRKVVKRSKNQNKTNRINRTKYRIENHKKNLKMLPRAQRVLLKVIQLKQ